MKIRVPKTDAEIARMEHADGALIADRLAQLDREWDVERVLQANASTLVMIGVPSTLRSPGDICFCRSRCLHFSRSTRCRAGVHPFL